MPIPEAEILLVASIPDFGFQSYGRVRHWVGDVCLGMEQGVLETVRLRGIYQLHFYASIIELAIYDREGTGK